MSEARAAHAEYFYPNKMGRIVLLSLEEVIGHNAINAVHKMAGLHHLINNYPPDNLDRDFRFGDLGVLQEALEGMFGPRAGRGLALRAGRACFKYGLREFGPVLGISDLAFRLLPLNMKIKVGIQVFADAFNQFSDQVVRVEDSPERYLWHIERCPVCWGRKTEAACCHLAVGILQESLYWVSGGRNFLVEEGSCTAAGGDACTICVARQPLD